MQLEKQVMTWINREMSIISQYKMVILSFDKIYIFPRTNLQLRMFHINNRKTNIAQ